MAHSVDSFVLEHCDYVIYQIFIHKTAAPAKKLCLKSRDKAQMLARNEKFRDNARFLRRYFGAGNRAGVQPCASIRRLGSCRGFLPERKFVRNRQNGVPQQSSIGIQNETYLSTFQNSSCTHPWFSGAHENPRGPCRHQRASRQRPQAAGRLNPVSRGTSLTDTGDVTGTCSG